MGAKVVVRDFPHQSNCVKAGFGTVQLLHHNGRSSIHEWRMVRHSCGPLETSPQESMCGYKSRGGAPLLRRPRKGAPPSSLTLFADLLATRPPIQPTVFFPCVGRGVR